jgi:hypothetical protein
MSLWHRHIAPLPVTDGPEPEPRTLLGVTAGTGGRLFVPTSRVKSISTPLIARCKGGRSIGAHPNPAAFDFWKRWSLQTPGMEATYLLRADQWSAGGSYLALILNVYQQSD